MWTREQANEWKRNWRKKNNNADTRIYESTPKGFLMRKYRNMQSRVMGIQKLKAHLYFGKSLLPREKFYEWALKSKTFWKLWRKWVKSNRDRKLCPTVDRIDPEKGYELSNMEWITHSENSSRGSIHQHQMKNKLKI